MSQSDTSNFSEPTAATFDALAGFSALADPGAIAGTSAHHAQRTDPEADEVTTRLHCELQRRAQQVEALTERLASAEASASDASSSGLSNAEIKTLKQQLDASNYAAREAHELLAQRDVELEASQRDQKQLRRTLERMQREFEDYASERARVRELSSDLSNRSTSLQMLSEERDELRRTAAAARNDQEQTGEVLERANTALKETRARLAARETDADALRSTLVATQKQSRIRDCEINELKTALSIAGETLASKRADFETLSANQTHVVQEFERANANTTALEQNLASERASGLRQTAALQTLTEEVARIQQELAERKVDVQRLRERGDERERDNHTLRDRAESAEASARSLTTDLDREKGELAIESDRAKTREETIAEFQQTLASIGKAVSLAPSPHMTSSTNVEVAQARAPMATTTQDLSEAVFKDAPTPVNVSSEPDAESLAATSDQSNSAIEEASENTKSSTEQVEEDSGEKVPDQRLVELVPARNKHDRPAIFRSWRDQQVAKQLAPLGVTSADDYFAAAIDPILEENADRIINILSLGGDDAEFELRLAQNLRRRGREAFRIHYPELAEEQGEALRHKADLAGIDVELIPFAQDDEERIETIDFRAIVSDGALSRSNQCGALVERLRRAVTDGTVVIVGESTGGAATEVAQEMGERIWQLMPDRYKTNALTGAPVPHYWNEDVLAPVNPDLASALSAQFKLRDHAHFGHLIDRFIGAEVGPNFDPEDERDRKFIDQIANLDAAKLDAGAVPPLYFVARLARR